MKKTILSAVSSLLVFSAVFGQRPQRVPDPSNTREGESVEFCHTHKKLQKMIDEDPAMFQLYQDELHKDQQNKSKQDHTKGTIYKIPVVFHVIHNGGEENISDEQIYDALNILNRDYRRLNADAANVQSQFDGVAAPGTIEPQPSDVEIEFVLATKAPNGACFKGITRTQSALSYQGDDGDAQVNAIVAGNDVFNGQWPGNRYMNVFVCGDIGGAAGYTYKPAFGGTGMKNGIWVLHNYVGSIGTASVGSSRTLTHEAGHWLNLDHTWGGNNNPGNTSSCGTDDNVQDTPNCIGVQSCNLNANTCTSDDGYFGFAIKDNVENYMDYSYCSKMFTQGQVTRMRNAITSSSGGRNNLWTANNLNQTGATGVLTLCKADFFADRTTVCVGDAVQFTDDTYNAVTDWNWSFAGGTPATSTEQNPSITYSTPGVYQVSLSATDGSASDSETKTAYITVLPAPATIPFLEGFESYTSLDNLTQWQIINQNNNNKFTLESNFGHTGTKCAKLINYGQTAGSVDELQSGPVDLSGLTAATLSFRYAYRKRSSSDLEYLKVFISKDCGENWAQRLTRSGNSLGSIVLGSSYTSVSPGDWVTVHMTNVTSDYWVDNFRYKFRFESDYGNNFFLDNINIYEGSPSDNLVLNVTEEGEITGLNLYPNPSEGELNLSFTVPSSEEAILQVQDISGKIVKTNIVKALEGNNLVVLGTDELAAGTYFLNIQVGGVRKALQFVVK
ncbi:MAG: zinc-dependent metalloprotease [Bacteroidota bacterium]